MTTPRERAATAQRIMAGLKLDAQGDPAEVLAKRMREAKAAIERHDRFWNLPGSDDDIAERLFKRRNVA